MARTGRIGVMRVVLISTYEMGRQPFGLASPAAWLRQDGATVVCQDLSRSRLDREAIATADVVAFYVPMHTATRIATHVVQYVKELNPHAHLCFYGLYAPMNEVFLRSLGHIPSSVGSLRPGCSPWYAVSKPGDPTRRPNPSQSSLWHASGFWYQTVMICPRHLPMPSS
jgi:hypothetical protein